MRQKAGNNLEGKPQGLTRRAAMEQRMQTTHPWVMTNHLKLREADQNGKMRYDHARENQIQPLPKRINNN